MIATQKSLEIRNGVEAATIKLNQKVLLNMTDNDKLALKNALNTIIMTEF